MLVILRSTECLLFLPQKGLSRGGGGGDFVGEVDTDELNEFWVYHTVFKIK